MNEYIFIDVARVDSYVNQLASSMPIQGASQRSGGIAAAPAEEARQLDRIGTHHEKITFIMDALRPPGSDATPFISGDYRFERLFGRRVFIPPEATSKGTLGGLAIWVCRCDGLFSGYRFLIEDWSDGRVRLSSGFSTLYEFVTALGSEFWLSERPPYQGPKPNPTSEVEARWELFAKRFVSEPETVLMEWGGRLGPERNVDVLYRIRCQGTDARGRSEPGMPPLIFSIIGYPIFIAASPSAFKERLRFPSSRSVHTGAPKGASDLKRIKVFLSYRRDDAASETGRLRDALAAEYGAENVFMDIDSVPLGVDFVDTVLRQVAACDATLVLIGDKWASSVDSVGRRRLDNADDVVRVEIAAAMRQSVPVVPVLVRGARMPLPEDLPLEIRGLARRNGLHLSHEQWAEGIQRLLNALTPKTR